MKKQDAPFWGLVLSLIFGAGLDWPLWAKILTILLAGTVLAQVAGRVVQALGKEKNNGK